MFLLDGKAALVTGASGGIGAAIARSLHGQGATVVLSGTRQPVLDELAAELGDKITIAKLNIDENPHVPTKYGVRGIPTMMIFQDGQVAATKVGALPKSKIKEWIESSI